MHEAMDKFKELLERELKEELATITKSGKISPDKICTVKDAVKLMIMIGEYEDQEGGESYSGGYSSRRGRSRTTGRYMSRDGGSSGRGSYDSYDSRDSYRGGHRGHSLVDKLEQMYEGAHTDKERQMIDDFIRKAEQQ